MANTKQPSNSDSNSNNDNVLLLQKFKLCEDATTNQKDKILTVTAECIKQILSQEGRIKPPATKVHPPSYTLKLHNLIVEEKVSMPDSEFFRSVSFNNVEFKKGINLERLDIDGDLSFRECTLNEVNLSRAHVKGDLSFEKSKFLPQEEQISYLDLEAIQVSGTVKIDNLTVSKQLDMYGAQIGRNMTITNSHFKDWVVLGHINVHGNVMLRHVNFENRVSLSSATINGDLNLDSTFNGEADLNHITVHGTVRLIDGLFEDQISLNAATINSELSIGYHNFTKGLDAQNARIKGFAFSLDYRHQDDDDHGKQCESMTLNLSNAVIDELSGFENIQKNPPVLNLVGTTINQISSNTGQDTSTGVDSALLLEVLDKSKPLSIQPYHEIASIMRDRGLQDQADVIIYHGRKRLLCEAKTGVAKIYQGALWILIGFGYYNSRAVWWILLLTGIGSIILMKWKFSSLLLLGTPLQKSTPAIKMRCFVRACCASFDFLVPLINLDTKRHSELISEGGIRYYFFIHKILGYVLASFIVAGLSGLTQ